MGPRLKKKAVQAASVCALVLLGVVVMSRTSFSHGNIVVCASKPEPVLKMTEMFRQSEPLAEHLYTYKGALVIPERSVLETYSRYQLEDLYHRYVENIQIVCHRQIHFGKEMDGGYYFCEDIPLQSPCMMYSFGTRNDYSFDDKIANDVGCDVHSFDPGDGQQEHKRSERVWFHAIGLGGVTRIENINGGKIKWNIYDLKDTRKLLHHENRTLDILKIDTEGMIWETLVDITRPGVIDDVKYLIMELHTNFPRHLRFPEYRSKEQYVEHLESLSRLFDLGFRQYYFHRWHNCKIIDDKGEQRTGCHDVHFIQTKFLRQ